MTCNYNNAKLTDTSSKITTRFLCTWPDVFNISEKPSLDAQYVWINKRVHNMSGLTKEMLL